jgi:hypothetical protein
MKRIFSIVSSFLTAIMLVACAPSQKHLPKYTFSAGTRVGIVNNLESYATHKHYSSVRIDNFTKKYDVDWDMPAYVEKKLTDKLQHDGRYMVIPIKQSEFSVLMQQHQDMSDLANSGKIKPEFANRVAEFANQYDLDMILVIYSFNGPSPHKIGNSRIELEGYGLFSRWVVPLPILPFKNAYSYAQIAVTVFKSNPLTVIDTGKPKLKKSSISGFDWSHGAKNLALSEMNKALPGVRRYADAAVKNALTGANLIPSKKGNVSDIIDSPSPK